MNPLCIQILELIYAGMTTRQIAEEMSIATRTVRRWYIPLLKEGLVDNRATNGIEKWRVKYWVTEKGKEFLNERCQLNATAGGQ